MSTSTLAPGYRNIVAALRLYRPAVPSLDALPQQRAKASDWISRWRLPLTTGIAREESYDGWKIFKSAQQAAGHVLYLHGGGLVFYSVEDFSSLMAHFAFTSGCDVTAFQYPKAPEHRPHEIVDLVSAKIEQRLSQLAGNEQIVMAGDSIGGYLALYFALRRFPGKFKRLVLIYPVLDLDQQRPSYLAYGRGYCLNADMMAWFQSLWHTAPQKSADSPSGAEVWSQVEQNANNGASDGMEEFSPFSLTGSDVQNLPQTVVVSAEMDILRDEAHEWSTALQGRNLPVQHRQMSGLAHDFCLYGGAVPEARAAVDFIASQLRP